MVSSRLFSTTTEDKTGKLASDGSHSDFMKQNKVNNTNNNENSQESGDFDVQTWLAKTVKEHHILLFMKGSPENPRCGFSSTVVQILNSYDAPFASADILENEDIRQGLKKFSNWPTFPQLYVNGEFIGGCDIVKEMHAKDELKALLLPPTNDAHTK